MVESDVCMCKSCWEDGSEDMRHVVRHRNEIHASCPRDYPPSELKFLPDNSAEIVAHWQAEWHHAHADHSLCQPHYLFGCTAIELTQLQQLQRHQAGDHASCPKHFPQFMLKNSASNADGEEEGDELSEETKSIWIANWQHMHDRHELCKADYNYGCEAGNPAPMVIEGGNNKSPVPSSSSAASAANAQGEQ